MEKESYRVYGQRWLLLAGICICTFCGRFVMNAYSSTIDVVQEYFRVSKYQSELFIHGYFSMEVFFCLFMAVIGSQLGFRILSIGMGLTSLAFAMGSVIGFTSRNFYGIAIVGNFVIGIATTFTFVLPSAFSAAWFPPNEVATAMSISYAHQSIGVLPSIFIFTQLLPQFQIEDETGNLTSSAIEEMSANRVRDVFMVNMSVIAAILTLTTIMFWVYSADRPPSPPSASQANIYRINEVASFKKQAKKNVLEVFELFTNKEYMLLSISNSLAASVVGVTILLYQSMLHSTFPELDERPGGYLVILSHALGLIGNLAAGRALDKFRKYKGTTLLGVTGTIFGVFGIMLGHFFKSLTVVFIASPLAAMFRKFTITCYVDFLIETTYPRNNIIVTGTHLSILSLATFLISSIEGFLLQRWGIFAAMSAAIIGNAAAFVLTSVVKPNYKRSNMNEKSLLLETKK